MVQTIKPTNINPKSLQKQHGYKAQKTEYKLKQYKLKVLKISLPFRMMRNCEALESYEHESPETQQYTMIIVYRKT